MPKEFFCEKRDMNVSMGECLTFRNMAGFGSPCEGCKDWLQHAPKTTDNVDDIIERMMGITGSKSIRELGEVVGGNIYQARNLQKIPDRWFKHLEEKFSTSREWLETGRGKGLESTEPKVAPEADPTPNLPNEIAEPVMPPEDVPEGLPFKARTGIICMNDIPTEELFKELSQRLAPEGSVIITTDMTW
ncbi:hypothetical protein [uncultured Pseudodesulfovibrio sp.]|uniref:hypothetical protein n=1 Tax=uncultured Pseudodesulfovibrio sp. TaxID=2035858 RepID=UPI0029C75969|nr:hypothetical protein [uncultured Pseudodesulfovibrio sp.]